MSFSQSVARPLLGAEKASRPWDGADAARSSPLSRTVRHTGTRIIDTLVGKMACMYYSMLLFAVVDTVTLADII